MGSKQRKIVLAATVVVGVALATSTAVAGTGVGGVFNLGKTNTVNAPTTLAGATAGKQLQVTNTSTGGAATGIGITVASGKPPLTVNSKAQVANLNASLLGGTPAGGFVQGVGSVTQSGLVVVPLNTSPVLAVIPNVGLVVGNCHNASATNVSVVLETNAGIGPLMFASSTPGSGGVAPGTAGLRLTVLFDTGGGMGTAQISNAGKSATINASAVANGSTCDFSAQVVYSHT